MECHSGAGYAGRPLALHWQGERLEIREVQAQWRAPRGPVFRVITTTNQRFELAYLEDADTWLASEI